MSLDGFLGVNKPAGCTSHDVVDRIRKLFRIKKVGHTGTLDPMATGVLILCLGKFTRLSQFVTASDKKYRAECTLGIETDTQDREGQVVARFEDVPQSSDVLQPVLQSFLGKSEQIPPMHSAVRVGGKRLYELARKGEDVAREARHIEIFGLDLVDYQPPLLNLDVWCSKGTYVRTLAFDLGQKVGCGAHLSQLKRTAVGQVSLDACSNLDALADFTPEEVPFLDVKQVLGLPSVCLSAMQVQTFVNGNAVDVVPDCKPQLEQLFCVFDGDDHLIGIGRWHLEGLRPARVIAQRES